MLKIIIAGCRDFYDYRIVEKVCNDFIKDLDDIPIEIVSGCARGADQLGEKYAAEKGFPVKKFPAYWDKLGKAAGPIRNKKMAEYADMLIAFWDKESRGTKNMIEQAGDHNLPTIVYDFVRKETMHKKGKPNRLF